MIIYFTDRMLNILGHASTTLPSGYRITDDKTVESVTTGVNTFSCNITYTEDTRTELEESVQVGRYILKQSGRADAENTYDSLYQIIETEFDTKSQELTLYAEDAGLDLLNTLCPAVTLTNKTITQMMQYFLPSDWSLRIIGAPSTVKTYQWEGESTATDRLMSVANLFDCELYYSFTIDKLAVTAKTVNVVPKRGDQTATAQLRLNYDVDRIYTKKSIADLVTALDVKGSTLDGKDTPLSLKGYTYNYTDPVTGDVYTVDQATGQMRNTSAMKRWASAIDEDGLLVGSFTFETKDRAVLAGQARAQLQKSSQVAVNYEVDFAKLPDNIRIGDRVNIIDEQGELYLEARLLEIETCEAEDKQTATIGEFLLRDSGISDQVIMTASEFAGIVRLKPYTLTITSSAGSDFVDTNITTILTASVVFNGAILSANDLAERGIVVNWYNTATQELLGTGMTYTVTNQQTINITGRLEEI